MASSNKNTPGPRSHLARPLVSPCHSSAYKNFPVQSASYDFWATRLGLDDKTDMLNVGYVRIVGNYKDAYMDT